MVEAHIEVRNLVHAYDGSRVVEVDRLSVERGKTLALIGPNGSGKSTLLRLIGLLERPTSGKVLIDGIDPWGMKRELGFRRRMAAVFQEPLLFSGSVFDNVAYGLRLRRMRMTEIEKRVERALETVGIPHLAGRSSNRLSGGEAQRTSLARALALEPEILLLDEPLASLDPSTRESLLADFQGILRRADITTVYVTHSRSEALALGDEIAVMVKGSIEQVGHPRDVFERPATLDVADIVGAENRLLGVIAESSDGLVTVKIDGGEIEALSDAEVGEEVLVCIRPEDITLFRDGAEPVVEGMRSSARNRFSGKVVKITNLGALSRIAVDACVELVAFVTKRSAEDMGLVPGVPVIAAFKATGVHIIRKAGGSSR